MTTVEPLILNAQDRVFVEMENLLVSRDIRCLVQLGDLERVFRLTSKPLEKPRGLSALCKCGYGQFAATLSDDWLQAALPGDIANVNPANLPADLASAVLEIGLQPFLSALEPIFGEPVGFIGLIPEPNDRWTRIFLASNTDAAGKAALLLSFSPEVSDGVHSALAQKDPAEWAAVEALASVRVAAVIGSQSLSIAELGSLKAGSVVLLRTAPESDKVSVRVGKTFAPFGIASLSGRGIQFTSIGGRTLAPEEEDAPMGMDDADTPDLDEIPGSGEEAALEDIRPSEATAEMPDVDQEADVLTSIDDIEVNLDFVVGRTSITVAELRELRPGVTKSLDTPATANAEIYASGKRLGDGELVEIDGQLGVRIVRLFGEADEQSS